MSSFTFLDGLWGGDGVPSAHMPSQREIMQQQAAEMGRSSQISQPVHQPLAAHPAQEYRRQQDVHAHARPHPMTGRVQPMPNGHAPPQQPQVVYAAPTAQKKTGVSGRTNTTDLLLVVLLLALVVMVVMMVQMSQRLTVLQTILKAE